MLAGIEPPIWRRLLVPCETTLTRLHHILQTAMGWGEYHEHGFRIDGTEYGPRTIATGPIVIGERGLQLHYQVRTAPAQFTYRYDFGDSWRHTVTVEDIQSVSRRRRFAVCLGGQRACPPEDVGGVGGYREFLEALADPSHMRHQESRDWIGGTFDPEAFDRAAINQRLKRLR